MAWDFTRLKCTCLLQVREDQLNWDSENSYWDFTTKAHATQSQCNHPLGGKLGHYGWLVPSRVTNIHPNCRHLSSFQGLLYQQELE